MTPDEITKAAQAAQQIAVRDYTFGGLLFLVLAGVGIGSFYMFRFIVLRWFEQQAQRDANKVREVEALKVWSEGFVAAVNNGANRITDAIESLESTGIGAWHEHVMARANEDKDLRDSERELLRQAMREAREKARAERKERETESGHR